MIDHVEVTNCQIPSNSKHMSIHRKRPSRSKYLLSRKLFQQLRLVKVGWFLLIPEFPDLKEKATRADPGGHYYLSAYMKYESSQYPFSGQYLTSSSVSSFVMLDFFMTSLAGSSFLQAASEKVTPMNIMTVKIGNDNFMTGSFPTETHLLLWNTYKCIIAHLKSLKL